MRFKITPLEERIVMDAEGFYPLLVDWVWQSNLGEGYANNERDNGNGALMRLSEPVDFDAPDGLPVDLIFGLIVPKQIDASHHADIESISVLIADLTLRARLRAATSSAELYDVWQAAQSTATPKVRQSQSR